jgi:phosphoserine phosphatase
MTGDGRRAFAQRRPRSPKAADDAAVGNVIAMPGALLAVDAAQEAGHRVVVITAAR